MKIALKLHVFVFPLAAIDCFNCC